MEGWKVVAHCIVVCVCAVGPVRIGEGTPPGSGIMGGGIQAALPHGSAAPAAHSSAPMPPAWQWQSTIEPNANNFDWKLGAAVSIFERTLAVGPARDWDLGTDQGGVQMFAFSGRRWNQCAALSPPSGDGHSQFGASLALQNRMLLVGAPRDSEIAFEQGAAFVYRQTGEQWDLDATLRRSVVGAGDQFGAAVACDEHTLVIGAPKADEGAIDSGAVEVFERVGQSWRPVATLVSNPPVAGALFGLSIAIDGGRIVVGAPGDRTDGAYSGRAFIFTRGAGGWSLEASLSCPGGTRGWFGSAVSASQGRILIGAPRLVRAGRTDFDPRGAVFEFRRAKEGWFGAAAIMPADPLEGDSFGCAVALQKDRAVFGASADSRSGHLAGAAFAGSRNSEGLWSVDRLAPPDAAAGQLAGHAVALFGPRIVVGRLGNPEEDPAPGAVSVFVAASAPTPQREETTASAAQSSAVP
ncbi:MAG: FG-GAP repeat protein [Planctomycetes bacterium]|nr:FG-GAP repeat protein [Planctomycetota bacterium]